VYAWLDLWEIATVSATALFGPWPDSSMRLVEVICPCCWRPATARCLIPAFIVYTIRRGGSPSPSSTRLGRSLTSYKVLHLLLRLGYGGGPGCHLLSSCAPASSAGTRVAHYGCDLMATTPAEPGRMAMAAWRTVATSNFRRRRLSLSSSLIIWTVATPCRYTT
jgi:hypothetical protein